MDSLMFNLKRSLIFVKSHKKRVFIILVLSILSTLISIVIPSINGNIINNVIDFDYKVIIFLAILAGLFQVFNTLISLFISKNYLIFKKDLVLSIRKMVFDSIINFKNDSYNEIGQGTIINKVNDDSRHIALFLNNIKDSLLAVISNVGILFYIFYLNSIIGIYYLIVIIISLLIRYYGVKKSIIYKRNSLALNDENTSLLSEVIKGSKDIKTLKLKDVFLNKTNNSFERIGEYEYKSGSSLEYFNSIARLSESIFSGIMVFLAIFLINNNLLDSSNFIIIFMYRANVFNFPNKFASLMNTFGQFNVAVNRIFSVIDNNGESFGNAELDNFKGNIVFNNVDFSYDGKKNILNNFDLKIDANSFVTIVGKNGVGKSTIFNLITKMVTPNSGNIYFDDYDLGTLTENSIRSSISLVNQQPYLFNFSIKENLEIIDSNFDNIVNVCKRVGIHDKIMTFKDGYNTKIGTDACLLSGGEKQKLAIARVLLSKTKVILLDEITNNLDVESRDSILDLLNDLKGKYTIIMITHDFNVCKSADRVIVLDNGKIVGDGLHDDLLGEKYYNKIYDDLR